jgi:hypothetical protein
MPAWLQVRWSVKDEDQLVGKLPKAGERVERTVCNLGILSACGLGLAL